MFDTAINFTMKYEVGQWFNPNDPETKLGLYASREQRKKVGYVNDSSDTGGITKFGVAQNSHKSIVVNDLTWDQAKAIYEKDYFKASQCDKLHDRLAIAHFDACVNHGVSQAAKFLQRAVGTPPDGIVGPMTIAAANSSDCLDSMLYERRKFYKDLVYVKPAQGRFLSGWLARVDALEALVKAL